MTAPRPGRLPDPPPDLDLRRDEPLASHTYLRIGGPAALFGTPRDLDALERIASWCADAGVPLRVIGGGSNLLVADEGVAAVVVSLRRACGETRFEGATVDAGAAVMLPRLARAAADRALSGLEFAVGIPGAIGGALQTNAGIGDGRDLGGVVQSVDVLERGDRGLTRRALRHDEIRWGYRETSLRGSGAIVVAARLVLRPGERDAIEREMRRLLEARQASQPTASANAGSVFRNPPGDYAGRLIDAAGCKGLAHGGARVSDLHANFIVHDGAAAAADVLRLMSEVQRRVADAFGTWLVPEVEWWGDGPPPAPYRAPSAAGGAP